MTIACPSCGRQYAIPPEKAAIPGLTGKCRCGTVFTVADAVAPEAPPPAPPPAPVSVPAPLPRPVAPAPAPPVPAAASAAAIPAGVPAPVPTERAHRPPPWPRCANHPQVRSMHVCPQCVKGYCDACTQKVQGGAICAACDGLCVTSEQYGRKQDTATQRARSMMEDIGLIARYPFRDLLGFVVLAVFLWVFGFVNGYLAHGILVLYAFHALTRVSNGDLKSFLPDSADLTQILRPARLALAAFVISSAPLIAVTLFVPGADLSDVQGGHAREPSPAPEPPVAAADPEDVDPDEEAAAAALAEEPSLRASGVALLAVTFLWMLVYTPVALTVAALSHSYLSTLNPVIGIDVIRRMGATYWHAMAIYSVLAFAQWLLGYGLDHIPIAGALVRSFTDAYAWLAIACTLGLAVFKKAEDLGWD